MARLPGAILIRVDRDGRGEHGAPVHDGVYFCVMEADGFRGSRLLVRMR